jgi:hypothetical protein
LQAIVPAFNDELLAVLGRSFRQRGDASVTVDAGDRRRVLHLRSGQLVASESNVSSELFGKLVSAARGIPTDVVEKVAAEARGVGSMVGDHLVALGFITHMENAQLLELQLRVRFEQSLWMPGAVAEAPLRKVQPTGSLPVGGLVVGALREPLPFHHAEALVLPHRARSLRWMGADDLSNALGLLPNERTLIHEVRAYSSVADALSRLPPTGIRLVAAFLALGVVSTHRISAARQAR